MNTDSPTLGLPRGIVIVPGTPRRACQRTAIWCWAASATPAATGLSGGTRLISGGTEIGGGAQSWFSLWTDRTSIDLHAAGGSLTPISTQHVDGTNAFPLMFNSG